MEVEVGGRLQERTHILPTKIIRVLSFAPDLSNPEIDEEISKAAPKSDEDPLVIPDVNNMRSDLIQLIAMLEGQPDDIENVEVDTNVHPDLADDLGLEQWLEEDEWEDDDGSGDEGANGTAEESNLEELD